MIGWVCLHPPSFIMKREILAQYLESHSALRHWSGFKAVLFDMDGVLYDSMPNHAIAWHESMLRFGLHMSAEDAYATEGAKGVDTIIQMVKEQQGKIISEQEAQRMYDVKAEIFHSMPEAPLFEGVKELMKKIVSAGMTVNVVTGSAQKQLISRLLDDFHEFLSPDRITTAYDVQHGKPQPDPYLAGLRKAGNLTPSQGIVIENAPLGIRAGVAAGCFTVAVNSGPLPDETLLRCAPHHLYANHAQLLADFDSLLAWQTDILRS